jgi:hypothetical protein
MSDIVKEVLSVFKADTSQYNQAVNSATKTTEKLDHAQEEQQKQSEASQKSMLKLGKGLDSVDKLLGNMVPGLRDVSKGFKGAEGAAKSFGKGTAAAIAATGIGALILILGKLTGKFMELREKSTEELSFMEKGLVDVGNAVMNGIGKALEWVKGLWMDLLDLVAPGLAESIRLHEQEREAILARNKAMQDALTQARQLYEIRKAEGASAAELHKLNMERLSAEFQVAKDVNEQAAIALEMRKAVIAEERRIEQELQEERKRRFMEEADRQRRAQENADYTQQKNEEAAAKAIDLLREKTVLDKEAQAIMAGNVDITEQLDEAQEKLWQTTLAASKASVNASKQEMGALSDYASLAGDVIKSFSSNRILDAMGAAAMAILRVWEQPGPVLLKLGQSALVAFQTAKQINDMKAADSQMQFASGGVVPARSGGMIEGRRHYQGGVKFGIGGRLGFEAEGGEFIVNRRSTARFLPLLEKINTKFADGGLVASRTDDMFATLGQTIRAASRESRPVLVIEHLRRAENNLAVVENLARR